MVKKKAPPDAFGNPLADMLKESRAFWIKEIPLMWRGRRVIIGLLLQMPFSFMFAAICAAIALGLGPASGASMVFMFIGIGFTTLVFAQLLGVW